MFHRDTTADENVRVRRGTARRTPTLRNIYFQRSLNCEARTEESVRLYDSWDEKCHALHRKEDTLLLTTMLHRLIPHIVRHTRYCGCVDQTEWANVVKFRLWEPDPTRIGFSHV